MEVMARGNECVQVVERVARDVGENVQESVMEGRGDGGAGRKSKDGKEGREGQKDRKEKGEKGKEREGK